MDEVAESIDKDKVYTYNEMLNLYIDKKLYWAHQSTYLIDTTSVDRLDAIIKVCNDRKSQDEILHHARVKDWLIILNLEKNSRNGSNS